MIKKMIIEIPKNSNIKYEINPNDGKLYVDRVLYGSNSYPENYGYFENTLDWDGDALDGLLISNSEIIPGAIVEARIIGALEMIDDGETDTKIITIINVDPIFNDIKTIEDLPKHLIEKIKNFFKTYKVLQNKEVEVNQIKGIDFTKKIFDECTENFEKYGSMDKKEFIELMKKENPKKYK